MCQVSLRDRNSLQQLQTEHCRGMDRIATGMTWYEGPICGSPGIGAVQAWFTVKVHPQVDGKLENVLFTEGQHVKKGDVLARIDARLFQAALDQAKAKKAQDAALLVAAEKDLARFKT